MAAKSATMSTTLTMLADKDYVVVIVISCILDQRGDSLCVMLIVPLNPCSSSP